MYMHQSSPSFTLEAGGWQAGHSPGVFWVSLGTPPPRSALGCSQRKRSALVLWLLNYWLIQQFSMLHLILIRRINRQGRVIPMETHKQTRLGTAHGVLGHPHQQVQGCTPGVSGRAMAPQGGGVGGIAGFYRWVGEASRPPLPS